MARQMPTLMLWGNWLSTLMGGEGWFNNRDYDDRMTCDRALSYPPVYHCVSKITGAFMIMPLNIYREQILDEDDRQITKQTNHSSYQLMRWRPNELMTPSQWKRLMMCHVLLWGNGRSYIRRDGKTPVELIPLMPDRTTTMVVDGEKWHATLIDRDHRLSLFVDMEGKKENIIWMRDADVWHIPGLGFDGINGKSLISLASQSWGIGLNAQSQIANQQKKGYSGGINLEVPAGVFRNEADAKRFLKEYQEQHAGVSGDQIGMLREGIKASVMAMSNQDAQFIEQRRFQREDAALLFVLDGILGDSSNASFASLEARNISLRVNCLGPWATAMEEESDLKLLTESERNRGYYHKFQDGALLRTEKSATAAYVSQLIAARVMNPNEAREMLDLNPYEGGDEYTNPNTTSSKPDNGAGGAANQPDPLKPKENKAIAAHFGHLFGVEANRVTSGAEKATNFIEWLDNYYAKNFEPMLADNFEAMGLDREFATTHCSESKRRLLEVCDYSKTDTLVANVSKCVSSWKSRANNLGVEHV